MRNRTYTIFTEYGDRFDYSPRSYDMAVRVAYFLRKLIDIEILVRDDFTGRATSEVHDADDRKDRYARTVARRLVINMWGRTK